jgi:hypothetical protein
VGDPEGWRHLGETLGRQPWCLGPQGRPYGLGLALTQGKAQQSLRLNTRQLSNTPPLGTGSHNSATADIETGPKLIKHRGGKTLRGEVDELRCRRDMKDADLTDGHLLSDKMKINLHVLGALMLNGVGR